jgi:uncharacterized protein Yka (UPF0111/DUF47 family)
MFRIVPRDKKFFDQIEQLSTLTRSAADSFGDLVSRFPSSDGIPERIAVERDKAAVVLQESLCRLDDAFITPLDREDILQLITDLFECGDLHGPYRAIPRHGCVLRQFHDHEMER